MRTPDEAIAAYYARQAINATAIKAGRTSMRHMHHAMTRPHDDETSPAMELGKAVHAMLLTNAGHNVAPYGGIRRGKEWEAFAADNVGKLILPQAAFDTALAMEKAGEQLLRKMFCPGAFEEPIFWQRNGKECKALPDFRGVTSDSSTVRIVDIKTTGKIDPRSFERSAYDMGLHIQAGWYAEASASLCSLPVEWFVIAIESKQPHDAILYRIDDDMVDHGRREACQIADRYAECCEARCWPGIAGGEMLALALPTWVEPGAVDMSGMEGE
jgi:hypothetical protein